MFFRKVGVPNTREGFIRHTDAHTRVHTYMHIQKTFFGQLL